MNQITAKAVNESIVQMLQDNQYAILEELTNGVDYNMSTENAYARMIMNCLSLSVKLSSQVVLGLLEEAGVIEIDERELAKLLLKQLSSELHD